VTGTPTRTQTPPPGTGADLIVSKTVGSNPATPGQHLTYKVVVVNRGPDPAVAVTLSDPLPAGTTFVSCTANPGTCVGPAVGAGGTVTADLGTIAVGGSATITIVVNVTATYGNLVNTATATSTTPDPDPDNNHDTAVTTVGSGIPMLSPPLLGLLALMLAAAGLWFVRRD
jgi:uncharacterized repeat protein (TIGR01451 family)